MRRIFLYFGAVSFFITACNSSNKVVDANRSCPVSSFTIDEVAVPVDTVCFDTVAVVDEMLNDFTYAESSTGMLLVDGDYTETGQFHRGIGMFGASFSVPPSTYHISMYEDVLIRTFPDNSYGQYNYDSEQSDTGYRKYRDANGSKWWICYNTQNNTFFVEAEMDGYYWNCDIVPSGSYNSSVPAQNVPQNILPDNSGREIMYMNQYEVWERTAQRNWEMLTTRREGSSSVSIRMNFRNAQSQMRQIRQNAQMEGIYIYASPWENASVPYSLYED